MPALTGRYLEGNYGEKAKEKGPVSWKSEPMYYLDTHGYITFPFGYMELVSELLRKRGYRVVVKNLEPHPRPKAYEPYWDQLFHVFEPRHEQADILLKMCVEEHGCIDCPPAYGKTKMMSMVAVLFPYARIDYVAPWIDNVKTLYNSLQGVVPDVGMVTGSAKRNVDARVCVYSVGSLEHSDGLADFLIGDEIHKLAADSYYGKFAKYEHARAWGFSATIKREDGKHFRTESIFGPVQYVVTPESALLGGAVTPVEVRWKIVDIARDPAFGIEKDVPFKRKAFWTNKVRNQAIAEDARLYDEDTQVLILVGTVEHAVHLKKLLPDFSLVYAPSSMSPDRRVKWVRQGLLSPDEPTLSDSKVDWLRTEFEANRLKKVIATTKWDTGVDFRHLQVLIRGDGGASSTTDVQIPGRVMRLADGKTVGIVHDYIDRFNDRALRRSFRRKSSYAKRLFQQKWPLESERRKKTA